MAYCHLAAVTGSADSAGPSSTSYLPAAFRGGWIDHDGHQGVWLSAREAAEVINTARNTAAKYLAELVKLKFLVREKLGEAQQFGRNRCWYYRPGPECPDFLLGKPVRTSWSTSCSNPEQSTKPTSKPTNKNGAQALKNNSRNSRTQSQTRRRPSGTARPRRQWTSFHAQRRCARPEGAPGTPP